MDENAQLRKAALVFGELAERLNLALQTQVRTPSPTELDCGEPLARMREGQPA
jgi:hypothetical protein